ncbi:MAG: tetratricopeptide repeat protein [Deltaproteobacteria bacterium]|nr:tetratricopeptide repeat protein [Deltaproteobacteria bacterium]
MTHLPVGHLTFGADLVEAMHDVTPDSPARPPPKEPQPDALLFLQVLQTKPALFLNETLERILPALDAFRVTSSSNLLLVGARGDLGDASGRLLRLCTSLLDALPQYEGPIFRASAVHIPVNVDKSEAELLLNAILNARRHATRDGLLFLDDPIFQQLGKSLAEVPGARGCVDPKAPFKNDRWELSALLHKPPFWGRDAEYDVVCSLLPGAEHLEEEAEKESSNFVVDKMLFDEDQKGEAVFDESAASACLDAMGDVFARTGRWLTAVSVLEKAVKQQHRIGDEAARAHSLCNLGSLLLLLGDVDKAEFLSKKGTTNSKHHSPTATRAVFDNPRRASRSIA